MRRNLMMAFCLAALAACGSSSNSSSGSSGSTGGSSGTTGTSGSSCTITLTGAVTATLPCDAPSAAYESNQNLGNLVISSNKTTNSAPDFSISLQVSGQFQATTYDYANTSVTNVNAAYSAQSSQGNVWSAQKSDGTGAISVVLSSATQTAQASSGSTYEVHGTADATLPGVGSATGTITAHVTF